MLAINACAHSFEVANPRYYHEWHLWETVKLAPGKILIPGLLGRATNYVEHPAMIAEYLVNYASLVGRENVIAGAECGFSSRASFAPEVYPTVAWAKLAALSEVAGRVFTARDYMRFCVKRPEDQVIRPEAVAAIRRVRAAGIKVGILTNDLAAFVGAEWKDEVAFFREIDAFTDVSYGAMKPDPRAYHEALKNLGTTAIETLFVDAQPHNVRGGEAVGMDSLRFDVGRPEATWVEIEERALRRVHRSSNQRT